MKKWMNVLVCGALMAAAAIPALAAGDDLLIAPGPVETAPAAYTVTVNGELLDLDGKTPYAQDELVMIPLRAVGEALGYTVTWNGADQSVRVDDGVKYTVVTLGTDSYSRISSTALGMGAPQSFGAAPTAVDGSTFVPTELFAMLGDTVTEENGVIALEGGNEVQLPNPIREYDTLEEALAVLALTLREPALPEGYEVGEVAVIAGRVLQVIYRSDADTVTFRAAAGEEDVSGDYNVYDSVQTVELGGCQVTEKGDGTVVNLALWSQDGVSYALRSQSGLSRAELERCMVGI